MADAIENQPEATTVTPAPSAETQNTDTAQEVAIPKSRFDEVNKRAKEAEKRLADLEKQAQDAEKTKLAETNQFQKLYETAEAKAAALETQLADMLTKAKLGTVKSAIETAARTAGFADPGDAHAFVDVNSIEIDEATGQAKGVEQLVKDLAKAKPYLVAQATPAPGNGKLPKPAGIGGKTDDTARQLAARKMQQAF